MTAPYDVSSTPSKSPLSTISVSETGAKRFANRRTQPYGTSSIDRLPPLHSLVLLGHEPILPDQLFEILGLVPSLERLQLTASLSTDPVVHALTHLSHSETGQWRLLCPHLEKLALTGRKASLRKLTDLILLRGVKDTVLPEDGGAINPGKIKRIYLATSTGKHPSYELL